MIRWIDIRDISDQCNKCYGTGLFMIKGLGLFKSHKCVKCQGTCYVECEDLELEEIL